MRVRQVAVAGEGSTRCGWGVGDLCKLRLELALLLGICSSRRLERLHLGLGRLLGLKSKWVTWE